MGLAGQREKQRISADPNNLHWSKDESKFGFRMLQKMGWSPGKGLGVNEDGHKEHVKIRLKDNNLGVGATKKNIDNWLGNTDAYSRLLADLNSQTNSEASSVNGDISAGDDEAIINKTADSSDNDEDEKKKKGSSKKEKKEKKEKKRKSKDEKKKEKSSSKKRSRDESDDEEEKHKSKKSKKDRKKDKKDKKEKKSKKEKSEPAATSAPVVLRNAARAKFLRAKKMASASGDKSMNEILGIKSTTTTNTSTGYQTIETSEATFMASFSI